jgi:hypothetical protein
MAVKSTPVQHEETDFAQLCTRLQQQLSTMEATMARKLSEQQEKYEAIIRELRTEVSKTYMANYSHAYYDHLFLTTCIHCVFLFYFYLLLDSSHHALITSRARR